MEYTNEHISNFRLKIGYWFITHKLFLKKLLITGLIVLNLGLFGYSIFRAVLILFIQQKDFYRLINSLSYDLVDYKYFREKNQPKNLQFLGMDLIPLGDGKYDLVAKVKNPNANWLISKITYQFVASNEVIAERTTFVYPNEEKYFVTFNVASATALDVNLNFKEIKWLKVGDFSGFKNQRLNFAVLEKNIIPAGQSPIRGKLPITKVIFKIKNESAYNFWQAGFYVILSSGSRIVGADYFNLEEFKSGEIRQAEANWYYPLPAIYQIEVLPEIDILNPDIYMKFIGEPRPDEIPR